MNKNELLFLTTIQSNPGLSGLELVRKIEENQKGKEYNINTAYIILKRLVTNKLAIIDIKKQKKKYYLSQQGKDALTSHQEDDAVLDIELEHC